jgi:antitoxin YefM
MKAKTAIKAGDVKVKPKRPSESEMVTISRQEYEGLKETVDLLSRPANARRLRSALAQAKAGKLKERDL